MRLFAALAGIIFCSAAFAQQSPAPDVAIFATVHANELRFTEVPDVTFTNPQNQNVWKSDRTNLPDRVQPYVTYRDIGIRLTITSTLPNIEQILNEALGPSANVEEAAPNEKAGSSRRSTRARNAAHGTAAAATAADHNKHRPR